jgi:hypothetical protein
MSVALKQRVVNLLHVTCGCDAQILRSSVCLMPVSCYHFIYKNTQPTEVVKKWLTVLVYQLTGVTITFIAFNKQFYS